MKGDTPFLLHSFQLFLSDGYLIKHLPFLDKYRLVTIHLFSANPLKLLKQFFYR